VRASVEIDEEFSGDQLAKEFKRLESGATSETADLQLMELKSRMGLLAGPAPAGSKQLGTGQAEGALTEVPQEEKKAP
ncbi:MAG: PspA/IM30 family protein, partial [Gemmatimonadaceae bacterium]